MEEFEEELDLDENESENLMNEFDEDLGEGIDDEVQMLLQKDAF